jgi:hypothetical protein
LEIPPLLTSQAEWCAADGEKKKEKDGRRRVALLATARFSPPPFFFPLSCPAARTIPFGRHAEQETPRISEPHCPK